MYMLNQREAAGVAPLLELYAARLVAIVYDAAFRALVHVQLAWRQHLTAVFGLAYLSIKGKTR
jgi:hypothetical protein